MGISSKLVSGVVGPCEQLRLPNEADGSQGRFRAPRETRVLAAHYDYEAVQAWLSLHASSAMPQRDGWAPCSLVDSGALRPGQPVCGYPGTRRWRTAAPDTSPAFTGGANERRSAPSPRGWSGRMAGCTSRLAAVLERYVMGGVPLHQMKTPKHQSRKFQVRVWRLPTCCGRAALA